MSWFTRKPDPRQADAQAAITAAEATFEQTARQLDKAKEGHTRAESLARKLHQIRERNHFGESLEGLYREKKS